MSKHRRHRYQSDSADSGGTHRRGFFGEYKIEIAIVSLFALGIFLLLERLEIKKAIYLWLRHNAVIAYRLVKGVWRSVRDVQGSDMVGILLILVALYLILLRFRVRILQFYPHRGDCPRCGATSVRRVPRTILHRAFQILLTAEIKRFRCLDCGREFMEMKPRRRKGASLDDPGVI